MGSTRRVQLRLIASALLAALATAVMGVGTALAGSGGPPFPK